MQPILMNIHHSLIVRGIYKTRWSTNLPSKKRKREEKGICLHEHKIDHIAHLGPSVAAPKPHKSVAYEAAVKQAMDEPKEGATTLKKKAQEKLAAKANPVVEETPAPAAETVVEEAPAVEAEAPAVVEETPAAEVVAEATPEAAAE